ncbi:MAG: NAD-dependent epimerase/dehydratase family protein [Patescibacteria group bacterium]
MQFSTAIVTGGAGFVGSHLVDTLVEQGVKVTVIDIAEPRHRNLQATYITHDIRTAGLDEIFAAAKPEVVFHLAAYIDDRTSVTEPILTTEHNVIGSLRVFEAARLSQVKKIIFASTSVVYGQVDKLPTTEKVVPKPLTPYAISKLTGEQYLHFYYNQYALPFVAFRIANIYGPRQEGSKESGAIAIFTNKLLAGQAPFMNNDGQTLRDYIHVSDVVAAFLQAATSEVSGVFNCATKVGTSTQDLFTLIARDLESKLMPVPRPEVKDAVRAVVLSSVKAKKELGWKPKIKLAKGLKQTLKWYRSQV